jgi:hypothetical protein
VSIAVDEGYADGNEGALGLELAWMGDRLPLYQVLVNALFAVCRYDGII